MLPFLCEDSFCSASLLREHTLLGGSVQVWCGYYHHFSVLSLVDHVFLHKQNCLREEKEIMQLSVNPQKQKWSSCRMSC